MGKDNPNLKLDMNEKKGRIGEPKTLNRGKMMNKNNNQIPVTKTKSLVDLV